MKRRDLIKKLEEAGFRFKEHGGNHDTYKRGSDTEQVPLTAIFPSFKKAA